MNPEFRELGLSISVCLLLIFFILLEIYFVVKKILGYIRGYMCFHEFGNNLEYFEKWVDAGKRREKQSALFGWRNLKE